MNFGSARVEGLEISVLQEGIYDMLANRTISSGDSMSGLCRGITHRYAGWRRYVKRLGDLCLGIPLLIMALPLMLFVGLIIKTVDPGPALFTQIREGYAGRPFRLYKLRSMVTDADRRLSEHLRRDPEACRQWNTYMKLNPDPRVIPVIGAFIRRFSLDELPQIWNVVCGDMSLVGPRPLPDYHLNRFEIDFVNLRRSMPPGITGLWQVSDRSNNTLDKLQLLDTYYVESWSLGTDVRIMIRTAVVVLSGKGAY